MQNAELVSATHLKCTIEAPGLAAAAKVCCSTRSAKLLVNGQEDKTASYDAMRKTATIQTTGKAAIEVMVQ